MQPSASSSGASGIIDLDAFDNPDELETIGGSAQASAAGRRMQAGSWNAEPCVCVLAARTLLHSEHAQHLLDDLCPRQSGLDACVLALVIPSAFKPSLGSCCSNHTLNPLLAAHTQPFPCNAYTPQTTFAPVWASYILTFNSNHSTKNPYPSP